MRFTASDCIYLPQVNDTTATLSIITTLSPVNRYVYCLLLRSMTLALVVVSEGKVTPLEIYDQ
jgi:hypothetical protein